MRAMVCMLLLLCAACSHKEPDWIDMTMTGTEYSANSDMFKDSHK